MSNCSSQTCQRIKCPSFHLPIKRLSCNSPKNDKQNLYGFSDVAAWAAIFDVFWWFAAVRKVPRKWRNAEHSVHSKHPDMKVIIFLVWLHFNSYALQNQSPYKQKARKVVLFNNSCSFKKIKFNCAVPIKIAHVWCSAVLNELRRPESGR